MTAVVDMLRNIPSQEKLTFDGHLRHAYTPLANRLSDGLESLDNILEILRLKIECEAEFARSMEKILHINFSCGAIEIGTIRDGLNAIRADMKNEYTQRLEFLNSLNEDVYQPCLQIRELYSSRNRSFAAETKSNVQRLRKQRSIFAKIQTKFSKVHKDAVNARTNYENANNKQDNKASVLRLAGKSNTLLKERQKWKEKYERGNLDWHKNKIDFNDKMTKIFQGMQSNEQKRLKTIADSLQKWAVFVTNLSANRNYDVKTLAQDMSSVDADLDMQVFCQQTLDKHPTNFEIAAVPPHSEFQETYVMSNNHKHGSKPSISFSFGSLHQRREASHSMSYSASDTTQQSFNKALHMALNSNSSKTSIKKSVSSNVASPKNMTSNAIQKFFKTKFKQNVVNDIDILSNNSRQYSSRDGSYNEQSVSAPEHTISSFRDSEIYPIDSDLYPMPMPNKDSDDKDIGDKLKEPMVSMVYTPTPTFPLNNTHFQTSDYSLFSSTQNKQRPQKPLPLPPSYSQLQQILDHTHNKQCNAAKEGSIERDSRLNLGKPKQRQYHSKRQQQRHSRHSSSSLSHSSQKMSPRTPSIPSSIAAAVVSSSVIQRSPIANPNISSFKRNQYRNSSSKHHSMTEETLLPISYLIPNRIGTPAPTTHLKDGQPSQTSQISSQSMQMPEIVNVEIAVAVIEKSKSLSGSVTPTLSAASSFASDVLIPSSPSRRSLMLRNNVDKNISPPPNSNKIKTHVFCSAEDKSADEYKMHHKRVSFKSNDNKKVGKKSVANNSEVFSDQTLFGSRISEDDDAFYEIDPLDDDERENSLDVD